MPMCMRTSTPRLCQGHITGSGAACLRHTSTLLPAAAAAPVNAAKKCFYVSVPATRASLWMGNHGDELWPAGVLSRSGCLQQCVCRSLVPPFRLYEGTLCVLDYRHVHLFARCVAFGRKASFPYCIAAVCRRRAAYSFPYFDRKDVFCIAPILWKCFAQKASGRARTRLSVVTCDAPTKAL